MTLGWKLFLVFLAFLTLLTTVIVVSFRERKRTIDAGDVTAQQAQDARVLAIIFSSIMGGMLLTLVTAWLVFF